MIFSKDHKLNIYFSMISSVLLCGFDQGPIHIPWTIHKSKLLFQTTVVQMIHTWLVSEMLATCTWLGHDFHMSCIWPTSDIYMIAYDLHRTQTWTKAVLRAGWTCVWLENDLHMTKHELLMTCNDLPMTCLWLAYDLPKTCSWLAHNLHMTCLIYFETATTKTWKACNNKTTTTLPGLRDDEE